MIILDDLRVEMTGYRKEMTELADVLDIKAAKARIEQLGEETAKPGFWDDLENSQAVLKEQKALERKIEKYNKLNESLEDVITLIELSIEEEDDSSIEEIKSEAESFKKKLEEERLATLLTGGIRQCKRYSYIPRGRRRNRGSGLGRNALSYVQPLGGASRL